MPKTDHFIIEMQQLSLEAIYELPCRQEVAWNGRLMLPLYVVWYVYLNQYLYIVASVWRFNETAAGYYQVREFQGGVQVTEQVVEKVPESGVLFNTS